MLLGPVLVPSNRPRVQNWQQNKICLSLDKVYPSCFKSWATFEISLSDGIWAEKRNIKPRHFGLIFWAFIIIYSLLFLILLVVITIVNCNVLSIHTWMGFLYGLTIHLSSIFTVPFSISSIISIISTIITFIWFYKPVNLSIRPRFISSPFILFPSAIQNFTPKSSFTPPIVYSDFRCSFPRTTNSSCRDLTFWPNYLNPSRPFIDLPILSSTSIPTTISSSGSDDNDSNPSRWWIFTRSAGASHTHQSCYCERMGRFSRYI